MSIETLEPIWQDNYTTIAMSSSNKYVPYLSVCLQSLIEHTSLNHNYDIVIFERTITNENKRILKEQICSKNISLRFVNPMKIISQYNLKFPAHYNLECYFRLASPLILKKYGKIIFTDVDLIFLEDIQKLYNQELTEPLAACQDLVYCAFLDNKEMDFKEYAKEILDLNNPYMYFNTGVMLLNLDYFRNNNLSRILLEISSNRRYRILEQDVLNKFFKDGIKYIDDKWNFPTMNDQYLLYMENTQEEYKKRYAITRKDPSIIHWAGKSKAWLDTNCDLAYLWWQYARKTPFYENILQNLCGLKKDKTTVNLELAFQYRKNVLNYWRYKILSHITYGLTKEHYEKKRIIWKNKIREGKKIRGVV